MSALRRSLLLTGVVAASLAPLLLPTGAAATTGNSFGLPVPKVLVDPGIGVRYVGRFYLAKIDHDAGIQSALFDIDYTEEVAEEFMVGIAQFYRYNSAGQLTNFVAAMYPFEFHHGRMTCELLVPGTTDRVLGHVSMGLPTPTKPGRPDSARVPTKIRIEGHTYSGTLQQMQDETPLPPSRLPRARQIAVRSDSTSSTNGEPASIGAADIDRAGVLGALLSAIHRLFPG